MNHAFKSTRVVFSVCILLGISLFLGCPFQSTKSKLYGTWNLSLSVSNEEFQQLIKQPAQDGVEATFSLEGTQSYFKNGTYIKEGEMVLEFSYFGRAVPLRFYLNDTGEWRWNSDTEEIVATTTEGVLTPLDDQTTAFVENSPQMAADLKPAKGQVLTCRILTLSEARIELQENSSSFTYMLSKSI